MEAKETYTVDKNEIKEVIEKHYPNLKGFYLDFVDDMLSYLDELNKRESESNKLSLAWTYPETIQVQTLNNAAERIKYQLIDRDENYIWHNDNPKNDYEKGLYNAMRLLHQIVHWSNPS